MSDANAPTNVSVRDLDYSGLRKAIDTRLNKYFEKFDAPESHEKPRAIHRNDFYKFTIRAEEPNVEFVKFVPKLMWCSKQGVYKHVSRERAYELRIVLDEFCEEWCSQWLTGDAGIFFVQIRTNLRRVPQTCGSMERRMFPRSLTEAELGAKLTETLANGSEDRLRDIMTEIVKDEGCEFCIYNENYEAVFLINIDPSKLSHNNPRKMITAYTFMDAEEIRKFLWVLGYVYCIDQDTRGAKIRCDLHLVGQTVVTRVKEWEQGDSDYDDFGDENEDESLFEEVLNSKTDGDTAWTRRVWFAFEQMKASQLRRVMHTICGGLYKLKLPAEEDYFKDRENLGSQRILGTVFIRGIDVVLTQEIETCDMLEAMDAGELARALRHLCNARIFLGTFNGKRITIDGRTITLTVCETPKTQAESPNKSEEQDPANKNPEKEKNSHTAIEIEAPDEELYDPESPTPRKRPRRWVETNQLLI
ncbi:hypothetical protein ACHAPG_005501 [Botrytis cinerea]